jgi:hypothetical protein
MALIYPTRSEPFKHISPVSRRLRLPCSRSAFLDNSKLIETATMASTTVAPTLPEGAGYGVVVGIGFFFTVVMAGISWAQVDQLFVSS